MKITYDKNGQILTYNSEELHVDVRVLCPTGVFYTRRVAVPAFAFECTRDDAGRELTYRDNAGFSRATTYDHRGHVTGYNDNTGFSYTQTYDDDGVIQRYANNAGFSVDYWYDDEGNLQKTESTRAFLRPKIKLL